jgi:tRNA-dihydrouridine synthase B
MFSTGQKTITSPLILAPMAGISDLPFRLINRSFGCKFAFTEMISARSLVHKNKNTLKMLSSTAADKPLGIQIFGGDPDVIKMALDILSEYAFDLIDFNAACPVNKVVSSGEGAALLKEPERLQKLLKVIIRNTDLPVTVKIRSGWDETSVNAAEVAVRAQDAGVYGVIVHGRTRMQGYSGKVDYAIIRKVKESLEIPVIGSGDALSPNLIKKMFDETGCDGVAIARGAFGNPWIFREAAAYLKDVTVSFRHDVYEIVKTMKEHLALNIACHGEITGVMLFRKLFTWYTRGMAVKKLRRRAFSAATMDQMLSLIEEVNTC